MLDELRDLFLRALKFDSKDKFDRIPLIREWNEAVDHVQEVFNHMTDKDQNLVPVVRCRECIFWDTSWNPGVGMKGEAYYCPRCHLVTLKDSFCSGACRKDGGQEDV